jgi:peptidoglycan/xylan/chitin deacetylase (PgdA/CDA1 family)
LLLQHQVPATVFLATGYIGSNDTLWFNWLDIALTAGAELAPILPPELHGIERRRLRRPLMRFLKAAPDRERLDLVDAIRQRTAATDRQLEPYRMLRWDEVRTMAQSGLVSFGGHTRTHPILTLMSRENAASEIGGCAADLQRELDDAAVCFAYPNGKENDFDDGIVQMVSSAGFSAAVTTIRGLCRLGDDLYRLRRITIDPRYTVDEVATNVAGLAPHLERGGD